MERYPVSEACLDIIPISKGGNSGVDHQKREYACCKIENDQHQAGTEGNHKKKEYDPVLSALVCVLVFCVYPKGDKAPYHGQSDCDIFQVNSLLGDPGQGHGSVRILDKMIIGRCDKDLCDAPA